jgi:hypothetical protein
MTSPDDGSMAEVTGSSRQGLLSFEVAGPFDSIAFDAWRGATLAPVCPSVEGGACAGPGRVEAATRAGWGRAALRQ